MKVAILVMLSVLMVNVALAQAQSEENIDKYMTAIVASDTILEGNTFEFKIIIRNLKGDFTPPTFADFDIVRGPNMSTSMQYTNGSMFRESTYTYYLKARKVGEYYIEESYLEIDGSNLETAAIPVFIMANPEQIEKDYRVKNSSDSELIFPFNDDNRRNEKNKKKPKRKLKKI